MANQILYHFNLSDMKKHYLLFLFLLVIGMSCQTDTPESQAIPEQIDIPEFLPMNTLDLSDLSAFESTGTNWSIAGAVNADFNQEWNLNTENGTGILVNQVEDQGLRDEPADGSHLFSRMQHGDIELKVKVLVPKGSNSGIYFQSRYELQIRDTAGDEDVTSDDMCGVYAQWKDPDNIGETIGGSAPAVNAARSPGLWQDLHVLFRAPKFDDNGTKTENARFEFVYLNGFQVQENVEVSSPTIEAAFDDETSRAPFMIQGNHGPIAFKDFEYKAFEDHEIELTDINYQVYKGQYDYIPDFSQMTPVDSGTVENFDDLTSLGGQNDGFNLVFNGVLTIPVDGEYLFETSIDDGGNTYIDGELIVHNQGEPGGGTERGRITLKKGSHELRQSYYQEVWGANLVIRAEGPGIEKAEIPARLEAVEIPEWAIYRSLDLDVDGAPELIRGFVNHNGAKKTHVLSVGSPQGLHYSYDTRNNQLLNLWKGDFADVGRMWNNRGSTQRLAPGNAVVDLETNERPEDCVAKGYRLNPSGYPVFSCSCRDITISDVTEPSGENGVRRTLSIDQGKMDMTVASGDFVRAMSDGWYSIGNLYYVKPFGSMDQWTIDNDKINVQLAGGRSASYEIFW